MELIDSPVLVKHGTTTLVAIGDPMWSPVAVAGGQAVQAQGFVRGAGIKAIPRGNEVTTVTFGLCKVHISEENSWRNVLGWPAALPRTMQDVRIQFADGKGVTIKNATIAEWPVGEVIDGLSRHELRITGGELVADAGLTTEVALTLPTAGAIAGYDLGAALGSASDPEIYDLFPPGPLSYDGETLTYDGEPLTYES